MLVNFVVAKNPKSFFLRYFHVKNVQLYILVQRRPIYQVTFSLGIMRSPVVKAIRKPWGCGRAARQKCIRNRSAAEVADYLLDRVDLEHIQLTGQLFPRGTLKSSKNRRLFNWVGEYHGRIFTSSLLRLAVKKLLRLAGPLPLNPKQSYGNFVQQQSERLGRLIRQAKRLKEGLGHA